MSLILDALAKSDRQRARNASERLREGPRPARREFSPAWLVFGCAATLLAAAVVVAINGAWQEPASRGATGAPVEIMENDATRAPVRDLARELVAAAAPEVTVDSTPPPAPSRIDPASVNAPASAATGELLAPPLASLPDLGRQLPALHVDIHAWAADPEARFVLINLRRYGEGDRLPEGPVVRRILRESVVLEFQGQLFSLPRN